MADIQIKSRTSADTSGLERIGRAFEDLEKRSDLVRGAVHRLGEKITDFSQEALHKLGELVKESIEKYSEWEKAISQVGAAAKQMGYDAGELVPILKEQAEALEQQLAVSEETVLAMDKLELRFGVAPGKIDEVNRAVLDLAAVMGTDAVSAMSLLMRSMESGSGSIKGTGIHFESTGSKAKDLDIAVKMIAERFGGAAAANAETLSGELSHLQIAVENLEKSFGGLFATLEKKTGALAWVTDKLQTINRGWQGILSGQIGAIDQFTLAQSALNQQYQLRAHLEERLKAAKPGERTALAEQLQDTKLQIAIQETAVEELKKKAGFAPAELGLTGKSNRPAGEDQTEQAKKAATDATKRHYDTELELARQRHKDMLELADEEIAAEEKKQKELEKIQDGIIQNKVEAMAAYTKGWEKQQRDQEQQEKELERANERLLQRLKEQKQQWENAGAQIGAAFVNALTAQLETLMAGGEFDAAEFAASMVETVLSVAGTIVGAYLGNPQAGAMVGSSIGRLGGAMIRSGFGKKKKMHSGGWVDDELPSYHGGGWHESPAMLLAGERVLSHREVSNMGGPGAVDSAAQGGGGKKEFHIHAIDARNVRDTFAGPGGLGLAMAVYTGQGLLPGMIRRK